MLFLSFVFIFFVSLPFHYISFLSVHQFGKGGSIIEPPDRAGAAPKVSKLPLVNDEHDTTFANSVYKAYVQKSIEIEKTLARLNYEASIADKEHKKAIEEEIKITKETVATMKLARDDMRKFISSFEEGESLEEDYLAEESGADSGKGEKNQ